MRVSSSARDARSSAVDRALRHVARTHGQRQKHRRGRRPAQERSEQLDRRRVGPVQIVEHEHERLRRSRVARAASARHGGCDSARAGAPPGDRSRASSTKGRRARAPSERRRRGRRSDSGRALARTRRANPRTPRTASRARAPTPSLRGRGVLGRPRERRAPPRDASFRCPAHRRAGLRPSRLDRVRPGLDRANSAPRRARRGGRYAGPLLLLTQDKSGPQNHKDQGAGSGCPPDVGAAGQRQARPMTRYLLHHRHEPHECGVVFASFKGHQSPLRHRSDPRNLPLRRPRDLVGGRGDNRRGRARPAAVLRRRAHHRNERERGRDPVTGPALATSDPQGGAMSPATSTRELAARESDGI